MRRNVRALAMGLTTTTAMVLATAVAAVAPAQAGATTTPEVLPGSVTQISLPAPTTTSTAAQRQLPSGTLTIGTRDRLLTTGKLAWTGIGGLRFDSVYQYVSGTGPGTKGDYHVETMVAFAQRAQLLKELPVLSYMRLNGNYKGSGSLPAACQATCTQGDTAKRNLDHLNDPSFMQPYFTGLVDAFRQLDANYTGQMIIHFEPDLSGYTQQLSIDRTRCAEDCVPGGVADDPAGVRASVAASGIKELSAFPDTVQGFFSAVLYLRDRYAPRLSLAYHVSDWATAQTGTTNGKDNQSNNISVGNVPVDAAGLGARVARFAAANGASKNPAPRPGPATSHYDLLFNDILDHDAGWMDVVRGRPDYWWDSENIDVPNFARWETYLGAITAETGLQATVWQVPIGNTVYKVENNTTGHYQDNKVEYFFDHLSELPAIGVNGIIFGGGISESTWGGDNQLDVTDNSQTVCTTYGSHSKALRCPTLSTTLTDDDGGYLRTRAQDYFAHPLALG